MRGARKVGRKERVDVTYELLVSWSDFDVPDASVVIIVPRPFEPFVAGAHVGQLKSGE